MKIWKNSNVLLFLFLILILKRNSFPDSDDEDDKSITAKKLKKRGEQDVKQMKTQLDGILIEPNKHFLCRNIQIRID